MNNRQIMVILALLAGLSAFAAGQDRPPRDDRRPGREDRPRRDRPVATTLPAEVARQQSLSIILGRPTDRSITANILSADAREGYIEFGPASGQYAGKTDVVKLPAGMPVEVLIDKLDRDRQYFYRLEHRKAGDTAFAADTEHSFHTQRAPGSGFVFEIQGDSHPERPHEHDPTLYAQTLRAASADHPDFYMTIGDDFSVDTLRNITAETVTQRYTLQRPFLSLVAQSAPLFLVNGNHEEASLCNLDGTSNNVAVWAQTARNKFFPQPGPDDFYTGDAKPVEHIGLLRDYYAWTWGDALFVVIDPYWHSPKAVDNVLGGGPKPQDMPSITLSEDQYKWLKATTLEGSTAKHKFVFTHHVLGTGRGGVEVADLFEWGGKDRRGRDVFAEIRPGWAMPIHKLFVKAGVTIFFQGHDHLFAHQQLDGVVYQTLPQPADPNYALADWASAYRSGDVLPSSGRVRVTVSPSKVRVEYVRSRLPKDATAEHPDGEVAFAYEVPASQPATTTRPSADRPSVGRNMSRSGPADRPAASQPGEFRTAVPDHPVDTILGRPTATSVTLSILFHSDSRACVAYGPKGGDLAGRTEAKTFAKGVPQEVVLTKLKPDTQYVYQLRDPDGDKPLFPATGTGTFNTQRRPGVAFTFAVQADSHLDGNTEPELYRRTIENALADALDFHVDLGDTFMVDKHPGRDSAAGQYLAQRYYLGLIGQSAPVFLVLGNHDGEDGKLQRGGADSLAVWSNMMRNRYFPNPTPEGFYTGNATKDRFAGLLQDYYAWEWGDALFIVLDPYWFTHRRGGDDNWSATLGTEQYAWLKKTLEASKSRFKFVFIHQLVGGLDSQGRGGVEAAPFYEWGGKNADGNDGFKQHRPDWEMPIHQLLVRNHVTIVFHGHDHLFAKQDLDGIVYQTVPQPGCPKQDQPRHAADYGYTHGDILAGSGHLRVKVSKSKVTVDYVRAFLPKDENGERKNAQIGHTYVMSDSR